MRPGAVRTVLLSVALLAGCASGTGSGSSASSATLTVHVGVFGGPLLPDGKMAASNAPDQGTPIVVTDRSGRTQRAKTGAGGVATFTLAPGHYTVDSPKCGSGPQSVAVGPGRAAHVNAHCDVP